MNRRIISIILGGLLCIIIAVVLNLKARRPGSSAEEPGQHEHAAQINITVTGVRSTVDGKKLELAVNGQNVTIDLKDDGSYDVEVGGQRKLKDTANKPKPKPKSRPRPPEPMPEPKDDERAAQMRRPEVANNIALAEEAFSLVEQLRPKMMDSRDGSGQYMWCAEKHERFVLLRTKKDGICLRFVTGEARFLCLNDNERGDKSLAGSTDQELANTNRELRWLVKLLAACE